MIRIIETNYNEVSFQSRIIDVESWQYLIDLFAPIEVELTYPKVYEDIYGRCSGVIRPRYSKVENLNIDNKCHRVMCDIVTFNGMRSKKLIEMVCEV